MPQGDLVGLVTVGNLVAKPLDLRPVGDIGDVRRDAQPLRQSRRLAEPLRFHQSGRRDVAHRDIASFRHSWRTNSRPIPLPPPVTTAILPANSVMCTSLAFWRRSK